MPWKRTIVLFFASVAALSLAACGGGSSSGVSGSPGSTSTAPGSAGATTSSNAVPSSVQGTVAYGRPVAGGYVVAVDVNGNKCGSATTASDGTYSMNTTCAPGPVEFAVLSGAPNNIPLMTIAIPANTDAAVSGTVNINPLTTMIVYDFLGTQNVTGGLSNPGNYVQAVGYIPMIETTAYQLSGPNAAFSAISNAYQNAANSVLSALSQTLSTYGVSVAGGFNPVTASFTANGQGIDAFFDAYPEIVTGSNNLQLGSSNPIISVTFSGSSSTPSTLGGSAASSSGGSAAGSSGGTNSSGTSGTSNTANGYNCAPGSYCYAYLGKTITINETVLGNGAAYNAPQYQESCSGSVAATPTTLVNNPATGPVQIAVISGSCTINGQTTQLGGYVLSTTPSSNSGNDPIVTYDGLGYSPDSEWVPNSATTNGAFPKSFSLDSVSSIGAVSGALTIN